MRFRNTAVGIVPRLSWRVLAPQVAKRLPPGYRRFQTASAPATGGVAIVAHYPAQPPTISPFTVNLGGTQHTIQVRTQLSPIVATAAVTFTGIYPGASIAADLGGGITEWGAICSFLAYGSTDTQPSHLVTCGHMFPPGAAGTVVLGGAGGQAIGQLVTNLLDSQNPRDIALVALTQSGRVLASQVGPGPKLQDYLPAAQIFDLPVKAYRPTIGNYSPLTQTASVPTVSAHISASLWPNGYSVMNVIATTTEITVDGDSGTILATTDPIAVGACSASGGGESLFEPLGRAIDDVFGPQYNLTFWKNP